jgi:hypothetical protein
MPLEGPQPPVLGPVVKAVRPVAVDRLTAGVVVAAIGATAIVPVGREPPQQHGRRPPFRLPSRRDAGRNAPRGSSA